MLVETTLKAPPSTILVVDDSPTNLQVLVRTLNYTGHRILAAKDGPTALDIAKRTQPDLMLLDVMMPGMDGFAVLRALKDQPETRNTLVIFLSARGEVADKVYFIASGEVEVAVGRERIKLGAGDHFGEIALITGQPRTATVTATDYSKFATLSRRDFLRFLQRFPSIREPMLSVAAERAQRSGQAGAGVAT